MADAGDYQQSWHYYHTANQKQRGTVYHDPNETASNQAAIREVFNADSSPNRRTGHPRRRDPILIVGMPRSGSTLVEQILASHSQVEGTAELPELGRISSLLGRYRPARSSSRMQ